MRDRLFVTAAVFLVAVIPAYGQVAPTNTTDQPYLAVVRSGPPCPGTALCVSPNFGIPLNYYATDASVASQISGVGAKIAATNRELRDAISSTAAVAAMHDAVPAPGDDYAIRANIAAANGVVAGGFSASANLANDLRASLNYGSTRGQSVVSAGLNFSFK